MASIEKRLAVLRDYLDGVHKGETVFILEDRSEFRTAFDPFDYILVHGAYSPDGRRIILWPHPVEGVDALSMSLYQLVDDAIDAGRLELPDLVSDEVLSNEKNDGVG